MKKNHNRFLFFLLISVFVFASYWLHEQNEENKFLDRIFPKDTSDKANVKVKLKKYKSSTWYTSQVNYHNIMKFLNDNQWSQIDISEFEYNNWIHNVFTISDLKKENLILTYRKSINLTDTSYIFLLNNKSNNRTEIFEKSNVTAIFLIFRP
jgi:hypothetical protein